MHASAYQYPKYEFATFNTCSIASIVAMDFLWKSCFFRPLEALFPYKTRIKRKRRSSSIYYSMQSHTWHTDLRKGFISCIPACKMFANMTIKHVHEHVTHSVDGFLYSVRYRLYRTRPRNKFPRIKWRHLCYGYGLIFEEMLQVWTQI
jgi:hypothetical protein